MCGIVAYYGKNGQTTEVLLSGLKRLEYRGYDSAGIALFNKQGQIQCLKAVGKIVNLESKLKERPDIDCTGVGIAHTRWATHGVPSELNAHPHQSFSKKLYLVHNGIIENYKELKQKLEDSGYQFYSETDTEVLTNLIDSKYNGDLKKAVLESLSEVVGAYATVVIHEDEPKRLVCAKKGSPMVLGVGDSEYIIGSDVSPIISKTREVVYIEDNEIVDINNGEYQISNLDNKPLSKSVERVDWDTDVADKGGYEHFLLKEIMEQPKAIEDSIRGRLILDEAGIKFGGLIDVMDRINTINKVIIVGIGTAYYSAKLGELFFEALSGVSTKAEMSPEFRYKDNVIDESTWVINISQSGETADTIAAIQEAKRKGALVTGIVNTVGSTVARITDAGVYNHIGPEISVASSKAFTSQSVILLMHALLLGRKRNLGYSKALNIIKSILKLKDQVQEVLDQNLAISNLAEKYYQSGNLIYVGRKYNFPVALEGALKIKEISYIHAEGLSGGELKHGFIALVDSNMPTVAIIPQDSVYEKMYSNLEEVKARSGKVISIATTGDTKIQDLSGDDVIWVPKTDSEETQAILNNIALQLFAYHCSRLKGLDVDKPRNLAKSVTVE